MTKYEIISLAISLFVTALSIGATFLSLKKKNKQAKINELFSKIPEYINKAESIFGCKTGVAKLEFVLNKLQTECIKMNVDISDNILSQKIEEILSTPTTKKENNHVVNKIDNTAYGQN